MTIERLKSGFDNIARKAGKPVRIKYYSQTTGSVYDDTTVLKPMYQGELVSGAGWTTGSVTPNSVYFSSGLNSSVVIPDNAALRIESGQSFSWSFWTKLNSNDNNVLPRFIEKTPHYMATMGDTGNARYKMVAIEVVQSGTDSPQEFWGNTELNTGEWYHIVGAFDQYNNTGSIYINGSAETVTHLLAWTGSIMKDTIGDEIYIGNRFNGSRNLDGDIDDVRQYNRFLTAADAGSLFEGKDIPGDFVAHWPLDEGTGSVVSIGETWTSGVILPIDQTRGSTESILVEQGKLSSQDKKLYIAGNIATTGSENQIKIGLGSPVPADQEYATIQGPVAPKMEGESAYKKLFIRRLTNGSLIGE